MIIADEHLATVAGWAGRSHKELDCEQLVIEAFRLRGIELPGLYRAMFKGMFFTAFELQPWDVVPVCNHRLHVMTHAGIYLGDGLVIHSFEDSGVVILPITREPWWSRIATEDTPDGSVGRRGYLRLRSHL